MVEEFVSQFSPETLNRFVVKFLQIGLVIIVGVISITALINIQRMIAKRYKVPKIILQPFNKVVQFLGVLIIAAVIFYLFGLDLLPLLAAAIAAIAIGFVAVWSVLSNFFCTIILILSRPFDIDDWIEFPGEEVRGKVYDLTLIFTVLRDKDGSLFQVPNNVFFQKTFRRKMGDGDVQLYEQLLSHNTPDDSTSIEPPKP